MNKNQVRVVFAFDSAKSHKYIYEIRGFANAAANIPILNTGTPSLPATVISVLDTIAIKTQKLVDAETFLSKCKEELADSYTELNGHLGVLEANAAIYIGNDSTRAAELSATLNSVTPQKNNDIPDKPVIELIEDGKMASQIKIKLASSLSDVVGYQIQYIRNYGGANEEVILYPPVITSSYKLIVSDLPAGEKIAFQVRATNKNGYGPWSNAISKLVN